MSEPRALAAFTPAILRKDYLVRRPADRWLAALRQGFETTAAQSDFDRLSAVLNNFGLLLFKGGMVADAGRLCRSHYGSFLAADRPQLALLAIQPWINE